MVKKLDKRRAKQCKGGSIRPKESVKLAPSTLLPLSDAPAWAVLPQFRSTSPPESGTTPLSLSAEASTAKCHLQYDTENSDAENSDAKNSDAENSDAENSDAENSDSSTCTDSDSNSDNDSN